MHIARQSVLNTPLAVTDYEGLTAFCHAAVENNESLSIDFTNTQIVTMRRIDAAFRKMTEDVDYFVPDGMPLIWCLNLKGAGLKDRVYGPAFMNYCLKHSPKPFTHYFLGGSETCLEALKKNMLQLQPDLNVVGEHHGYFGEEDEPVITESIKKLSPDFIWVGLGTPKQQAWIQRNRAQFERSIVLAVGFAFDVNAGTKKDAPMWMQRIGLTWLYRMCSEPRRLVTRYLKFNSLFLFYLFWDGLKAK